MRKEDGTLAQRQEQYGKEQMKAMEELNGLVAEMGSPQVNEKVKDIMDNAQNTAFMEGYTYAITVLEQMLGSMK